MIRKKYNPGLTLLSILSLVFLLMIKFGIPAATAQDEIPQYVVEEGMVDKATFNGYRRFHGICHTCHGQDAMGSTFAPSLVESLKDVDYATFKTTLIEGRTVTNSDGSISAMPPMGENVDVMKHQDDIYRYLKARSDGVLEPGRPKKIPK